MAAGMLSKPGSEYGPCLDDCKHLDCAQTRAEAASPCAICLDPIGYEERFYQRHVDTSELDIDGESGKALGVLYNASNTPYQLVHAECAEREAESKRADV